MQMHEPVSVAPLRRDSSVDGDIVTVGMPSGLFHDLSGRLSAELETLSPAELESCLNDLCHEPVVLGPDLDPDVAVGLYKALIELEYSPPVVVFGFALDTNWPNLDSCHFHSEAVPDAEVLAGILTETLRKSRKADCDRRYDILARIHEVLERVELQDQLTDAIEVASNGLAELARAEPAHYLEAGHGPDETYGNSSGAALRDGIGGYLVRAGGALRLDRVDRDQRFSPLADALEADGSERLLGVAVVSATDRVLGAFIALRSQDAPAFTAHEVWMAEQFAAYMSGPFDRHILAANLSRHAQASARSERASSEIYRKTALEYHAGAATRPGEPLRLSPAWVRWSYPAMLGCLLVGLAYTILAQVTEFASGPTIIQLEGRKEIVTPVGGAVSSIGVSPGQSVAKGDPLLHLYQAEEQAELRRMESEFEFELIQRLLNPDDQASSSRIAQLRGRIDRARSALEERTIRAPVSGKVPDLMVRPGQVFEPGDIVMTLRTPSAQPYVVALIPGAYRPRLRPGMTVRLEIDGYRHAYQELTIESVGEEVVGPTVARRYLGSDIADAVSITGPVVPVRARLQSEQFISRGREYRFHDGMHAKAEVAVGSRRLIFALLPGLNRVTGELSGG